MDGGSGLNLIYEETLQKMEIDWSRIERSSTTFRGIIPSREARCTGKITLDVVFGSPDNYRSEEVTFQVAPFNSGYHAILGREAFTIFPAVPHYGYMKLKMPGPGRIITLVSDPDIALRAENKTAALALEALSEALAAEELTALRSTVNRDDVILDKRSKSTSFKPADEIVKFQVHPTDPTKTASIGAQLNPDVDAALREFLRENWDIFCLAPLGYARNPTQIVRTQPKHPKRIQASQTGSSTIFRTQKTGNGRRASQTIGSRIHQRHQTSGLASKPGNGTKEGQILAPMCRFQRPK